MKMKKLLAVVFCMILCVGCLAGCGGGGSDSGDTRTGREQAARGSAALSSQGGEEMKEDKIPM